MNTGVIAGGWEYVSAAYGVTGISLLVYGVMLMMRIRDERSRNARGANRR